MPDFSVFWGVYPTRVLYSPEMPILARLEAYFEFQRLGTNWKTEILAGLTTFITMAYIVLVNFEQQRLGHGRGATIATIRRSVK